MWILLEACKYSNHIMDYDCKGFVKTEAEAMEWRNANIDYRVIKYCPNVDMKGVR